MIDFCNDWRCVIDIGVRIIRFSNIIKVGGSLVCACDFVPIWRGPKANYFYNVIRNYIIKVSISPIYN